MINGRSTSSQPRELRELFQRRMEQQGPVLGGGRLGTELETSLTPGGDRVTTTHKTHLPPAHAVPLTITQV